MNKTQLETTLALLLLAATVTGLGYMVVCGDSAMAKADRAASIKNGCETTTCYTRWAKIEANLRANLK